MKRPDPAWLVVLAGVSAALHVGKLPPALPVLRESLGIGLVEAGFLLSLVQFAGMLLGLAAGAAADSLGLRRTMVAGLAILSVASALGGWATNVPALLVLRACEGLGFLLAVLPAPALIRRLVEPERMTRMLGWWGTFMPVGTALALLVGPGVIAAAGWPVWWWGLSLLSAVMALVLWAILPASCDAHTPAAIGDTGNRIGMTLAAPGPWLVATAFAVYSAQWLAVIGFLPTIYAQAGVPAAWMAVATALAAGVNMVGNIASGRLLHWGVAAHRLLYAGYAAMALGTVFAFASWWDALPASLGAGVRYFGVLLFSTVGGVVPGTLFSLAVRVAPSERAVASTVGWMQQWSAFGQFAGPPVVGWVAGLAGNWGWTWVATCACAAAGMLLAAKLGLHVASRGEGP
ncbi:MAG: MFS transporter [Burkholderiales bacterium]|nr:MFS transporter [Burkholderiales bacterium]